MQISFASNRIEKLCCDSKVMQKVLGKNCALKLQHRLAVLNEAINLAAFTPNLRPERCHELIGDRAGQLSMDLEQPYRLIFEPNHQLIIKKADGGLDWASVTAIKILEVVDTH
jgi:plasmid maintenance system killer protein